MTNTQSHEWILVNENDNIATIGISALAQRELGEIVYVELPHIGREVTAGDEVVVLESTKAATDIYSPISGTIVEVNSQLKTNPELINQFPEKEGWLFKIKTACK